MNTFHPLVRSNRRMKPFSCLFLIILCLVPRCMLSQSTSATISGGITDTAGNFITGASVVIANDETGILYSVKSNDSGMYFVPVLPPGHYHLQISKQGFKTIIKPDVVLSTLERQCFYPYQEPGEGGVATPLLDNVQFNAEGNELYLAMHPETFVNTVLILHTTREYSAQLPTTFGRSSQSCCQPHAESLGLPAASLRPLLCVRPLD